ncbi:hypothetical protein [Cytophaga aurantiaca]|uniref:hypothetical protein n=1 Tax=Cytophaga aurantiaca TaxID=29530 RepID=UPI000361863B|nr:hypothetical protein [Cytophaga aurantiaca]
MIRFKDIHIPKPCSEDYDSLSGDEVKRFCSSCEKHVYDFRGKDEVYLNEVFQHSTKTCGIYYLDEINTIKTNAIKTNKKSLFIHVISFLIFIKAFLTIQDTKASQRIIPQTVQLSEDTDSTEIKTTFKGRPIRSRVKINIYINDTLYKQYAYPEQGYLYLPDSLKAHDKIKVKILGNKLYKSKTYKFKFAHVDKITVIIAGKSPIHLFKRRTIVGAMGDFW